MSQGRQGLGPRPGKGQGGKEGVGKGGKDYDNDIELGGKDQMGKNKGWDKGMGTQGGRCKDYDNDKNKGIKAKGGKEGVGKGMGMGKSKGWGEDYDNGKNKGIEAKGGKKGRATSTSTLTRRSGLGFAVVSGTS